MSDFFDMGGYGAFVWPAYALTLGIVVWNVVASRRSFLRAKQEAKRRLAVLKENAT